MNDRGIGAVNVFHGRMTAFIKLRENLQFVHNYKFAENFIFINNLFINSGRGGRLRRVVELRGAPIAFIGDLVASCQ